jgi:hypothetical protein
MTVVSSKEFVSNEEKYFQLAVDEEVAIKKGSNLFYLICKPIENQYAEQLVLEPDDIYRSAITMDEFRKSAKVIVENVHNRYFNEDNNIAASS